MDTPYVIVLLDETTSTQDDARAGYQGVPLLVVAAHQRRGRGRGGRHWQEAPRPLSASLALEPAWPAEAWPRIALVAGLAGAATLDDRVTLKWPNDLMVAGRKVGGLLVESADRVVVVGFGANLWWPDPPPGFGALHAHDPGPSEPRRVAERWASELLDRLNRSPDDWGREEYAARCVTIGAEISWRPGGSGRAVGVDTDGALLVESGGGVVRLASGEVSEVRPT